MFNFQEAERQKMKASIQIEGLTGRGKSGLALLLARGLASDWKKVYALDTENNSLPLYVGLPMPNGEKYGKFMVGQLTDIMGYKPSNYLAFRDVAIKAGAEVVIKDSITHAWQHKGGVLDLVNVAKNSNSRYQKDSYAAWSEETVAKEKQLLLPLLRSDKVHVITTTRVKEKMEYGIGDDGKSKLLSLGEQQIQQSELKYEPDLVLHMVKPGSAKNYPVARVIKTRYAILTIDEEYEFTPELIEQLRVYLEEGVDPEELLEQQRQDYIKIMTDYLKANKSAQMMYKVMKTEAGYKDETLDQMPLDVLKSIYIKITQ